MEVCYTSSYFHIFTSSHLLSLSLFLSLSLSFSLPLSLSLSVALCHGSLLLFLFSPKAAGSADEAPRSGHPFAQNEVRVSKTAVKLRFYILGGNTFARNEIRVAKTAVKLRLYILGGNPFARNEARVAKTHCRQQPFRTKRGSRVKNWWFCANLVGPAATLSHEKMFGCQKLKIFCEFGWSSSTPFAPNEVRVSKTESFFQFSWSC